MKTVKLLRELLQIPVASDIEIYDLRNWKVENTTASQNASAP
jgi:hypothetical protein